VWATSASTLSRKRGLFSRSGEMRSRSTSPSRAAASMACQSSVFSLLMVAERTPMRSPIWVWLRMRASSGETTRLGPAPSSRRSRVAMR